MRSLWFVPLVASLLLAGCLNDFSDVDEANHIRIVVIDVSAPTVKSGTMTLLVNTTLDNTGGESGDIRLVVKAYDTATGLLTTTATRDVGTIAKDRTVSIAVPVDVPRASGYRLEIRVHEDDQLTQTGTVTASNLTALSPNVFDTGLRISSIDFIVRNVTAGRVQITAKVYVTNEAAAASKALDIQVKAREVSTAILADEQQTSVPAVEPEETHAVEVILSVPDAYNYQVEAVLWDGNIIVERGSGNVQLLPTFTKDPDEEIVVTDPKIENFVRGRDEGSGAIGDSARSPSPGILVALGAVALAITTYARTKRRDRQ